MKKIFIVIAGVLLVMWCTGNAQQEKESAEDGGSPIEEAHEYRVAVVDSIDEDSIRMTFCYAIDSLTNERTKIVFGESEYAYWLNDGYGALTSFEDSCGSYVFVVGDMKPNSNGWVRRFLVYRVDTKMLDTQLLSKGAAVKPEPDGYCVAEARLTNPDAPCTAEQNWLLHDVYYDYNGNVVREDYTEYDYDEMEKRYHLSL